MVSIEASITNNQTIFSVDEENIEFKINKFLNFIIDSREIIKKTVLKGIDLADKVLSVGLVFCDDQQMQELNSSYRGKDRPTDVLSFALFADSEDENIFVGEEILLGEVIISAETADRQARENNKTLEEEVDFLLTHGILHLLGFDHPDEGSLQDMLNLQERLVKL